MRGVNRRDFIKTGAAGLAAATVASVAPPTSASKTTEYPAIDVAALDTLEPGAEVAFEYPDASAPSVLLRLREAVPGGGRSRKRHCCLFLVVHAQGLLSGFSVGAANACLSLSLEQLRSS